MGWLPDWLRHHDWSALTRTDLAAFLTVGTWLPLALAFAADFLWSGRERSSLARLARPSRSARLDLAYTLVLDIPHLVLFGLITPVALVHFLLGHVLPRGTLPWGQLGTGAVSTALTAVAVLVLIDLLDYLTHRLMHRSRLLWPFHEVHHAATEMTLLTGVRMTLTERHLIDLVRSVVLLLLGLSVPVVATVLFVRSVVDIVQHSNLSWTYGPLGYVIASPANHRLHHSAEGVDFDSNYGNLLSVWDHLFGTANPSMSSVNNGLTADRLPALGLPAESSAPSGAWLWPVLSDAYLWAKVVRHRPAARSAASTERPTGS